MDAATSTGANAPTRNLSRTVIVIAIASLLLLGAGLAGKLSAAPGYALFVLAGLLLGAGTALFAVFALSRWGDTASLQRWFTRLLRAGGVAYVLCVCALAGHYVHEAAQGRMEGRWILFGPLVLGALIALDYGLWRKLVRNNLPTWRRYRQYVSRDASDPAAMRRVLVDDVILHRSLYRASKVRWLRHALIFWGFVVMFGVELAAVVVRDGFPAFGWPDVWHDRSHPVRLAFAFIYDFTGVMILAGCLLALGWRIAVNGTPERRYSDTPTTLFLLFVVASGFVVEGLRILPALGDPMHRAEFAGVITARLLAAAGIENPSSYDAWWMVHMVAACAFIAYVPVMRLVHSCATPLGRLANSQQAMLAAKKRGVLGAMLRPPAPRPPASSPR